jgi:SPX domain protein involved in polyphosphate accumulation
MTVKKLTRDELVEIASSIQRKMIDDHIRADVRRSWNRFTGQLPSKNDIVRAALVDITLLNDICLQYKWEPLLEEEESVSMPKLKK